MPVNANNIQTFAWSAVPSMNHLYATQKQRASTRMQISVQRLYNLTNFWFLFTVATICTLKSNLISFSYSSIVCLPSKFNWWIQSLTFGNFIMNKMPKTALATCTNYIQTIPKRKGAAKNVQKSPPVSRASDTEAHINISMKFEYAYCALYARVK